MMNKIDNIQRIEEDWPDTWSNQAVRINNIYIPHKDLHSEDILYGPSSWLPALEPLRCNYHIGDNYYRGSFSSKYPSGGLYLL